PDLEEMSRRRTDVLAKGLPHLVASRGVEVLGFAYAGAFRPRPAYRFMAEDSVFIHPDHTGQGLGRALQAFGQHVAAAAAHVVQAGDL
ncbi:MAG: GNAT family N-acetyltransferase, partial [Betaproteobacteria bacterium]|nr:GNAT family N-acetyltransferase [Betaproteobacteria bacterium]